jgi:hypothetical protein
MARHVCLDKCQSSYIMLNNIIVLTPAYNMSTLQSLSLKALLSTFLRAFLGSFSFLGMFGRAHVERLRRVWCVDAVNHACTCDITPFKAGNCRCRLTFSAVGGTTRFSENRHRLVKHDLEQEFFANDRPVPEAGEIFTANSAATTPTRSVRAEA